MAYSEYSFASSAHQRPDKPLIVKCTFDRSMRRITFSSAQNCSFDLLRTRVEQCFSLYASSFMVTYKDDDGEVTDITCEDDLTEAIQYFHLGDDSGGPPPSSGASAYSGRSSSSSGGARKITLRVDVNVDYDGPSLSDTASLSSLEEYKEKRAAMGESDIDLEGSLSSGMGRSRSAGDDQVLRSFGREIGEVDEDAMTISSKPTTVGRHNTGSSHSTPHANVLEAGNAASMIDSIASTNSFSLLKTNNGLQLQPQINPPLNLGLLTPQASRSTESRTPTGGNGGDVFERLKLAETVQSVGTTRSPAPADPSGMAGWLKQQSVQMMQSVLGGSPTAPSSKASSEADGVLLNYQDGQTDSAAFSSSGVGAVEEEISGCGRGSEFEEIPGSLELELERNERGAYYYTYTGSTQSYSADDHERQPLVRGDRTPEEKHLTPSMDSRTETLEDAIFRDDPGSSSLEFLQYLPPAQTQESSLVAPSPAELTDCSSCGQVLDTFRYVCATCGPRLPRVLTAASSPPAADPDPTGKGKGRAPIPTGSPTTPMETSRSPGMGTQSLQAPRSSSYNPPHHINNHMHGHGQIHTDVYGHHHWDPHGFAHTGSHRPGHHHSHSAQLSPVNFHPLASSNSLPEATADWGPPSYPPTYPPQQHRPSVSYSLSPSGLSVWTTLDNEHSQSSLTSNRNGSSTSLLSKPLPSIPPRPAQPAPHLSPLLSSPRIPPQSSPGRSPISPRIPPQLSPGRSPISPRIPPPQSSPGRSPRHGSGSQHSEPSPSITEGFELCTACMERAGIEHASESIATGPTQGVGQNQSPGSGSSGSFTEPNPFHIPSPAVGSGMSTASSDSGSWKRNVPRKKGQLRHAFKEKVWGPGGWTDVEHDGLSKCSTCGSGLISERYKCATCLDMVVCRGCYSQIHEIHPVHAFLIVPETKRSEPATELNDSIEPGERSLLHDGLKCSHCLMEIVGARFHCAICPNVDICSNCESAGLPGNLTSPDGGHDSSHIMIKVPFPLSANEVDTASRRALLLWTGRDAPGLQTNRNGGAEGQRANSGGASSYAATIVGSSTNSSADFARNGSHRMDHGMSCSGCGLNIIGVRYQCASCPAPDGQGYSLCVHCEAQSYRLHDPMHCFFKIPRPVDRKIQEEEPLLPSLYILASGEFLEDLPAGSSDDPRAYLQTIVHRVALCDRCIQRIVGEWFRCAYCAKDLCDACEAMDSHDASHLFVVFKSVVDMTVLRTLTDVDNPQSGRPLIPYPVYTRPL